MRRTLIASAALAMMTAGASAQTQREQQLLAAEMERARASPMDYVTCSAYYAGSAAYLAATGHTNDAQKVMVKANHFKFFIAAAHYYVKNKTMGDALRDMSDELSTAVAKDMMIPGQKSRYDANNAARCLILSEIVAIGMQLGGAH